MRWWWMALGAAACGGGGDTDPLDTGTPNALGHPAADCAGDHRGTYSGAASGDVYADLNPNGTFDLSFTSAFGNLVASARVGADGLISATGSVFVVSGNYQFAGCTASGTWDDTTNDNSGTWNLSLQ